MGGGSAGGVAGGSSSNAGGESGGGESGGAEAGGAGGGLEPPIDAGERDAGVVVDAGEPDAGQPVIDAGPADLVMLPSDAGVLLEWRNFDPAWCDVERGCSQPGDRAILRYGFRIANTGGTAVDLRAPDSGVLTESCTGLPRTTLRQFADWELFAGTTVVAAGSSDVHCLADDERVSGSGAPTFTCSAQGLSSGFASIQHSDDVSACRYPDVSGLDAGTYSLKVRINPQGKIAEERSDNNELTFPVTLPDTRCRGTWCGATCCPPNTPCNAAGGCGLPDLTVDQNLMVTSTMFEVLNLGPFNCGVQERCVDQAGNRFLLRFSVRTPNIGDGDFYIGDPANNPRATWSPCHMHYHYEDFAEYRLLSADGGMVLAGHKQAFCAFDNDPYYADAGPGKYTCMNQGITVGWSDTYERSLECQWIDVTAIAGGNYLLEVEVNPRHVIAEKDYSNNAVRIPVMVPP
ncbi:MAG: hypothetical protein JNK82_45010 [Myxococcaceae bacterium]|nr:hypothetical protein [Myxococcaceae bacterium]